MTSPPEPTITGVDASLHTVALRRPWGADVTEMHAIEVRVSCSDGTIGTGFSWTPTIGPTAVLALLQHDISRFVVGRAANSATLWDQLWLHLHEAGSGGLTTIAMAGVDLALWDRDARAADKSLVELLGRRHDSAPVYGSGVNLHYTQAELVAQVERWVEAGYTGAKVKVGKKDLAEDVDRIAAVRDTLGPDRHLMIDANQRWSLETARLSVAQLAAFDLDWVEEPLRADDTSAYAELRAESDVPVAIGENAHTIYRFRDLIEAGACDVIQPNIVRVGGITPFLRIAEFGREHGLTIAPHLLPELSGQLALTMDAPTWVEDVEDASFLALGLLDHPTGVDVANGRLTADTGPGLGFSFISPQD